MNCNHSKHLNKLLITITCKKTSLITVRRAENDTISSHPWHIIMIHSFTRAVWRAAFMTCWGFFFSCYQNREKACNCSWNSFLKLQANYPLKLQQNLYLQLHLCLRMPKTIMLEVAAKICLNCSTTLVWNRKNSGSNRNTKFYWNHSKSFVYNYSKNRVHY